MNKINKSRPNSLTALILIAIIGAVIYSNTFDNSFVFDDHAFIASRTSLHNLKNPEGWFNFLNGQRPPRIIGFFSFALNYHFHGLDVFGYHLVNLLIHLINSFLLWKLLIFILSLPKFQKTNLAEHKTLIAIFGALLFLTHPIQTQAVTYIYQRLASLAALFYLLSLNLYLEGRFSQENKRRSLFLFICSGIAALFAMLTKENSFTLPLTILLSELFFISKPPEEKKNLKFTHKLAKFIPLLFLMLIPFLFSFDIERVFHPRFLRAQENTIITSKVYLLTQLRVIVTYIRLLFIPINQNLDYDYPIYLSLFEIPVLISLIFLSLILFLAIKNHKNFPLLSFGIFWFFITLCVESSIIPIRYVIFEHRLYLPMVGFSIFLSTGLYALLHNVKRYKICALIIIITLSMLTYHRNNVWQEPYTLWSDVVQKSPNKPYVHFAMGRAFNSKQKYYDAIASFHKALNLYKHGDTVFDAGLLSQTHNSLGIAYYYTFQDKNAIRHLIKALDYSPNSRPALKNLWKMYYEFGSYNEALTILNRALGLREDALAYYYRGLTFQKLNRNGEAESDLKKALFLFQKNGAKQKEEEARGHLNLLR